jgi:hypothetical protein
MSLPLLRRSPWLRSLALLVQVAAVLCQLAEGTGRVHCPHHDLVPGHAMAGMDHGAGHHQHGSPAGHACTCLGACNPAAGALPSSPIPAIVVAVSRLTDPALLHTLPLRAADPRQPPSTGPPLSA